MSDKMKKLKCEMLEIDLRRQELNKTVLEADDELKTLSESSSSNGRGRKTSRSWLTNMIAFKSEPIEVKNEKLNQLLSDCDERMVELSNIFLNEKIELIFRHNKEIGELNRQVSQLNRQIAKLGGAEMPIFMFDSHAQTELTSLDFDDANDNDENYESKKLTRQRRQSSKKGIW